MQDFRYKAFVSYSWSDAAWGKWLHNALETYRTPKSLIGKDGLNGPVPDRLHPLFKDREEEAAGASIGAAVEAALLASEFLILICSPRSAQSQWVNRELAFFKTHRDPAKVLALIVDGEPGGGELECFPRALTHQVLPDLTITDVAMDAPLAADARDSGDGKRKAKLKIAAAMLGLGLDELVNRDEARRTLRTRLVVGASLALATVMSGMAWFAIQARNEADHQRAEADGLVEFMLTDLREKLEPVGRLDALDVVGQRALKYYAGQKPGSLDADALGRRARALHLVGEVRNIRGDTGAALIAFQQAAASTAEQLARDPDNAQRIFDHAQSVFWVGYAASLHGDQKSTEAGFREYKRLAGQLVAIDPNDPKWLMEKSYAETNLGTIFFEQSRYPEAAAAFVTAVAVKERVVALQPRDAGSRIELGNSLNWLAQTRAKMGELKSATDLYHREIALYREILAEDPKNTIASYEEALTWQYLSNLKLKSGQTEEAHSDIDNSIAKFRVLIALESGNNEWLEGQVRAQIMRANIMSWVGNLEEGNAMLVAALPTLARLQASDPKNTSWSAMLPASLVNEQARIAFNQKDYTGARRFALAGLARLKPDDTSLQEEKINLAVDARLLAGDAEAAMGNRAVARDHWTKAIGLMSSVTNPTPYQEANRFITLKRLGRAAEAAAIARELDRQGYRHPAYLRARSA